MNAYLVIDSAEETALKIKTLIDSCEPNALVVIKKSDAEYLSILENLNPIAVFIHARPNLTEAGAVCQKIVSEKHRTTIPCYIYGSSIADHAHFFCEAGASGILDNPIDPISFRFQLSTAKKISELRERIHEQESSNTLLQAIISNAPIEIWARNNEEVGILENNLSAQHFGSILGEKPDNQKISKEAVKVWKANNRRAYRGEIVKKEGVFDFNGEKRNYFQIVAPIWSNQTVDGIVGFNIDITDQKLAEEARVDSEKAYRKLIEKIPDGVYKSTHDGKFLEVNQALVNMLGYASREELMAIDIKNDLYFHPDDRESIMLQEKYEEMGIFRLRKKDGSEIWVEDHGWYVVDKQGNVVFHEGIMRDITERRLAEEALRESEERFKTLYEQAPIGYQSLDENAVIIDVNETWLEMTGFEKQEVIGSHFADFMASEFREEFMTNFRKFKKLGKAHGKIDLLRKDGSHITVQLDGRVAYDSMGNFKQSHCVLSDITERLKSEKVIADERILLRTLIDNIPDAIYIKNLKGQKIISNKADLEILGLSTEAEVLGKIDAELPYPGNSQQTYEDDMAVIKNARPLLNRHESFIDLKGEKRYFLTSKIPLRDESGEVIGLVGVGHDITSQKISEQKIVQLSKAIEQSPASIIITDTSGNIEYANQKLFEISGYLFEEVKGKNARIFQSGLTSREDYQKLWQTISSGNEYRSEILNRKKNGELFWESVLISPIRDEAGNIVNYLAIKEDINDRKKSDLEILKLSVAIEQSPASVLITNTKGIIEYVNQKFLNTSGYTRKELIGKMIRILKPGHTPDHVYNEIWKNLFEGKEWRGEHENRKKNHEKYWESLQISPIKNKNGEITNFIVLSEDISQRKKMEQDLISAKEKAEESDRLKSAFLANMSHEIRTPLNSILGFSDLLVSGELDPQSREEYANLINLSGGNLLAIINDILDISKIEAGQIELVREKIKVFQLVSDIQKEYLHKAALKGIELKLAPQCETLKDLVMESDQIRIKQVLVNFVGNALKFTDRGFIEIGFTPEGNRIQFYVKDTGIGIPKAYHEKIFERFRQIESAQTRRYGGNGLGLAITRNLAELLGGKVYLESEPNVGSTFYFTVPRSGRY